MRQEEHKDRCWKNNDEINFISNLGKGMSIHKVISLLKSYQVGIQNRVSWWKNADPLLFHNHASLLIAENELQAMKKK